MNLLAGKSRKRGVAVTAAGWALLATGVFAQSGARAAASAGSGADSRISALMETLGRVHSVSSAAISPDGKYVAWSVSGARGAELHLTGIAGGSPDRVIAPDTIENAANSKPGTCKASHPAWSPNGTELAFLSNCDGSSEAGWHATAQDNLFVWTMAGNGMRQVSHLHGGVSSIQWSPDGKTIGFLYVENATRQAGALDAMKPWNGVYDEDGVEVQRVAAIELASGELRFMTPWNLHAYEFSWSPNSDQIVFVAAAPPGENNWWVAGLYIMSVGEGPAQYREERDRACKNSPAGMGCGLGGGVAGPVRLLDPSKVAGPLRGLQIAVPRFSPDGKQIAFIGGLMSDQGSVGGDIYLIPSVGRGEPKDVTAGRAASPAYIAWIDDHDIGISEHVGGDSHITALDLTTGKDVPGEDLTLPETIIAGVDVMSVSVARNSPNVAMIRQSFDHAPEVWAGPLKAMKQLTHVNDAQKPPWGKAESIEYTNDGFHIQGWLLYPANYDPAKKYPLLVSVHGGPSSAVSPRWPSSGYGSVPFSALGYFVFMPNPRGSYGQGEKFTQANFKDFGYGDMRDVLAGVDVLEKRFPIDKSREGLTGWSYGGFMTMFGVTQTTRFKAAVAGAGISNWQSYYGENSIDQWMTPFFGATVYDDPAIYAKSSAINFIKNVKTPTLVIVGDRDGECPAPQSFEFWHALKAEGVKTQLVIYPNEGHRFVDPNHQHDVLKRMLEWFESEMPEK